MTKAPEPPTRASGAQAAKAEQAAVNHAKNNRSTTQPFGSMASTEENPSSPAPGSSPKASPSSPAAASSSSNAAPSSPVVAVGESASPPAETSDESGARKQFDPWHFGAIPIPPELIKEYDEAMQRFESGETPDAVAGRALEAGAKVQAYKEGWGTPLARQFSEDAARVAVTQASMVRVRQARARQLALGAVAALSLLAFTIIWWGLGKSDVPEQPAANSDLAPTAAPLAPEAPPVPAPSPPLAAPAENAAPALAATALATEAEQVPTPRAGSNPESQTVRPVASEPAPASPKANDNHGSRPRAPEARGLAGPGPVATTQPAAPAPTPADDILGGPMTRRPKPKKTLP